MTDTSNRKLFLVAAGINLALIAVFAVFLRFTIAGVLLGVSLLVWLFIFLKRRQDAAEARFAERFSDQPTRRIEKHAHFRAQLSHGYSQASGQCYLVLTDEMLHVDMTLIDRRIDIPLQDITDISEVWRLKGVSPARKMLRIDYRDHEGNADAIAFTLPERERWIEDLKRARRECRKRSNG